MPDTSKTVLQHLRHSRYPSARVVLYPNNALIGALFTLSPWVVFVGVQIASLLLLVVPSYLLHLDSLTMSAGNRAGENVGFMHRPNWGPLYLTMIPTIFALASLASRRLKRSLLKLLRPPAAIQRASGNPYQAYLGDFARRTATATKYLFAVCLILAVVLVFADGHYNLIGYARVFLHTSHPPYWDEFDWMNVSQIPSGYLPSRHVYALPNALFYLVAMAFEGCVICLGMFWISAFWIHSRVFADLMLRTSDYRFVPWERDPDHRLGLKPIGFVYSTFLVLSIFLQAFVYYHRLQITRIPLARYFSDVFSAYGKLDIKQPITTLPAAIHALWPLNYFDTINPGMKLLIVASPLLCITIAWWPIVRLGTFINKHRGNLVLRFRAETQAAKDAGQMQQAKSLEDRIQALEKATVWPNGYAVGWGAFALLIILEISAIFPPLLPLLVVSGGLTKLAKYCFKK